MPVDFHPDASAELQSSTDWYAQRSVVAAQSFLVAVDIAVETIVSDASRFVFVDDRHQSCSVTKFPFQVVLRQSANQILIIAVAHAKRRSGYWRDR